MRERVNAAFGAIVDASDMLAAEMGERAAAGVVAEAMLTVQMQPYPRRVLAAPAPGLRGNDRWTARSLITRPCVARFAESTATSRSTRSAVSTSAPAARSRSARLPALHR